MINCQHLTPTPPIVAKCQGSLQHFFACSLHTDMLRVNLASRLLEMNMHCHVSRHCGYSWSHCLLLCSYSLRKVFIHWKVSRYQRAGQLPVCWSTLLRHS